ncbi:MAG: hypothetical protein OXM01_13910 [Gemmatimonadota bacterium]|nr:hypothetical protein [Gemmatimonadota bacterium]
MRLNLDIPKSTMGQLKIRAFEQGTSVSGIVRGLIDEFLSK